MIVSIIMREKLYKHRQGQTHNKVIIQVSLELQLG